MPDGAAELSRRVALLDGERGGHGVGGGGGAAGDLAHFVAVMSRVTRPGMPDDGLPATTAREADDVVAGCDLLRRLARAAPEVAVGPLRLDAQRWIATGKPSHVPRGHRQPSPEHLVEPAVARSPAPDAKPFGLGMFTSTATVGGHGAWRTYLDVHEGSSLFPPPWLTWAIEIEPSAVVLEVASAADWVELVRSHPLPADGLTYPDWQSLARACDGVHMTLTAIAATQGIVFPMPGGPTAAPYWDVESTLWLRWRVRSAELVDIVV